MKVISFSLWGTNPKYTVGAVRNAELAPKIYPGWKCRFYCGTSVEADTMERLRAFEHVEVVARKEPGDWRGLFWRFTPASDPTVEVMISRDTDSRLNLRERKAVDEWLKSDRSFHVMRDHPNHNVPVLGGLWGAKRGAVPEMIDLVAAWDQPDQWGPDQDFLAAVVAPRMRASWIEHDPYFARRSFPTRRRGREFVGQPFDEQDRPLIEGPTAIESDFRRLAGKTISWGRKGWNELTRPFGQLAMDAALGRYGRGGIQAAGLRTRNALVARAVDPSVKWRKFGLRVPLSHPAPIWDSKLSYMDRALPRIAATLAQKEEDLCIIDVGANVGDTVARLRQHARWKVLAIEGDPRFFRWLQVNFSGVEGVELDAAFLSDQSGQEEVFLSTEHAGTSYLRRSPQGSTVVFETLDEVLVRHPAFAQAQLVKVDTDGYDLKFLTGARLLRDRCRPVVFFKHTPCLAALHHSDLERFLAEWREAGYLRCFVFRFSGEFETAFNLDDARAAALAAPPENDATRHIDLCLWPKERSRVADEAEQALADLKGPLTWPGLG